jgi:hypothetical protein
MAAFSDLETELSLDPGSIWQVLRPKFLDSSGALKSAFDPYSTGFTLELTGPLAEHEGQIIEILKSAGSLSMPSYLENLDLVGFFTDYPGLHRALRTETDNFITNLRTIHSRVTADLPKIRETFFPDLAEELCLAGIEVTQSDPHMGGQRVCILIFNKNTDTEQKLVYKPRDIRIDSRIMNSDGEEPSLMQLANTVLASSTPLPIYRFLPSDDGTYGYVEFLSHELSETKNDFVFETDEEAQLYYHQLGQLEALAWLIGLTDLHQGNLIVHHKQPYLTDLEIAFDPLALSERGSTGLLDAITKFGSLSFGTSVQVNGGSRLIPSGTGLERHISQNWVFLLDSAAPEGGFSISSGLAGKFSRELLAGFQEVLEAFSEEENNNLLQKFVAGLRGMTVRYNPKKTEIQLKRLQRLKMNPEYLEGHYEGLHAELEAEERIYCEIMFEELLKRDVPYYTRRLGEGGVFFRGERLPLELLDFDGLLSAQARIVSLSAAETKEAILERGRVWVATIRENSSRSSYEESAPSYIWEEQRKAEIARRWPGRKKSSCTVL